MKGEFFWDGDILLRSVKSGYIFESFCSSLSRYDANENVVRVQQIERRVKLERRVPASHGLGTGKKVKNSLVLMRGKGDGEEEVWAARVLVLFR